MWGLVGVVVVAAGAMAVGIGAIPWLEHGAVGVALRDAEAQRLDGRTLSDRQLQARAAWAAWGLPLSVTGWASVALGGGVGVSALALPEDEPSPVATMAPTDSGTTSHMGDPS